MSGKEREGRWRRVKNLVEEALETELNEVPAGARRLSAPELDVDRADRRRQHDLHFHWTIWTMQHQLKAACDMQKARIIYDCIYVDVMLTLLFFS